jgi:polyribonucleotide nucleotidyltransferase
MIMVPQGKSVERKIGQEVFRLEAGRLAGQAGGAVLAGVGDTTVLATATASDPRSEGDFFPLTIDVEERMYAAGKIPGGFFRREGRASAKAILTARLIDRPLRPSFPEGFRHEVHCVVTALAVDNSNPMDVLAMNAASAALCVSDIPFEGPIGAARACHVDGQWVANGTFEQQDRATIELVVAGRAGPSGEIEIMMIEAGSSEHLFELVDAGAAPPDEELIAEGIEFAKGPIAEAIELQRELTELAGKPKGTTTGDNPDYPLFVDFSDEVAEAVANRATAPLSEAIRISSKSERRQRFASIQDEVMAALAPESAEDAKAVVAALRSLTKKLVRRRILIEGVRLDGRRHDEVRPIWCEVGIIPRVHGSAVFTRGETQALTFTTLGMQRMEQMIDDLSPEETKRYMHHYNFPPYSTGEAGFMRGPKRREIGHGALAEKALLPAIPSKESFPYAVRTVSEIISSNGSTSMASVCGSSLSLMDAGVPLRGGGHVGGVAMGLVAEGDTYLPLTDILGDEDAFGDMDFKVAGTADMVTALQLDVKIPGVPAHVLAGALQEARRARLHIISEMNRAITAPRPELAALAPRVTAIKIPVDKIGEVIGPKGKNINTITATAGVEIDIDDDGTIRIGSTDQESADRAQRLIEEIVNPRTPEVGERITGNVVKTTAFGAFVNIAPGRDGLVHISKLGEGRIDRVEDAVATGDEIEVEVTEVDPTGRISLTPVSWLERQVASGKTLEEARAAAQGGGGSGRRNGGSRDRGRPRERRGGVRRERAPRRSDG